MVYVHLPAVPKQGECEQRPHRPQPEQHVQHKSQGGQPDAPTQGAHPVVHQPQQRPKGQPLPEHRRLGGHIHIHSQRSSRDRKPPRAPPASSS